MNKFKIKNTWIITITLTLLLAFVFLIINTYRVTLSNAKLSHQKKQLEMVKSARSGMQLFLTHILKDVAQAARQYQYEKDRIGELLDDGSIKSFFALNEKKEVLLSDGGTLPEWISTELEFYDYGNEGAAADSAFADYWFSKVLPFDENINDGDYIFLAVLKEPIITNSNGRVYAGVIISFDWLMNEFILSLRLTEHDFAWVLDGNGRLIFHPNHEEMLLKSINKTNTECQTCHKSFDVQRGMITGGESMAEYFIEGEPHKIMAYAPFALNNQEWILAISTYLPYVVNDVTDSFFFIFLSSAGIIILILLFGSGAYYINLKRIQAEEAEKHFVQAQNFQEKLNHASKLASIGELVDSVAHEINTPTGIISTISDTMLMLDCAKAKCFEDLKLIKDQTKRIRNYTKSLLGFSRRMPFQPQKNNLVELIDESIFLVSPRLKASSVKVDKQFSQDFPEFIFDRGRLEQVIINILNNAVDFVERNGSIIIKLELEKNFDGESENVVLSIIDNGLGISQENIDNIFEPFFSTKPLAKGTGLGLSISKAIVERHNGKIIVESELNKGTTFKIVLPMIKTEMHV